MHVYTFGKRDEVDSVFKSHNGVITFVAMLVFSLLFLLTDLKGTVSLF